MSQMQFLGDWIQDVVLAGFVSAFLFFATSLFYPWWKSEFGWNVMALDVAIGLALTPAFLHRVFNVPVTSIWFLYVEAAALSAVPVIVAWRIWVFYKIQRAGASERRPPKSAPVEVEETGK